MGFDATTGLDVAQGLDVAAGFAADWVFVRNSLPVIELKAVLKSS